MHAQAYYQKEQARLAAEDAAEAAKRAAHEAAVAQLKREREAQLDERRARKQLVGVLY